MADNAVQKLRDAFANAPAGPVILNDAFWTGAGLVAPDDFTASIKAAFRLTDADTGLSVTYDRANVSPVAGDAFTVSDVALKFLDAPEAGTKATIIAGKGTDTTPKLGIDVIPQGWQLADQFPYMSPTSWPFVLLSVDQQRFYYASVDQIFAWQAGDAQIAMTAGQNLYGNLAVPAAARPLFQLVTNLPTVATDLIIAGSVVLDKADNDKILFPDMMLHAMMKGGVDLKIFFIHVVDPHLGMEVKTVFEPVAADEEPTQNADQPTDVAVQTALFYFGTKLELEASDGSRPVAAALQASVDKTARNYQFSLGPADTDRPITPAAIITLMSGGEASSYFDLVPPVLQQYLAAIQLKGFSVNGPLKPTIGLGSLSAVLGSVNDVPIPLFRDPVADQEFALQSFELQWTLSKVGKSYSSYGLLQGDFILFPEVFRTPSGEPGGTFHVSIDTELNFEGSFNGTASMDDVLQKVSGGTIGMPQGIAVSFSDISVAVRPSEKSYALGFTVDAEIDVPFVKGPDGQPLIQVVGMEFNLGAHTPNRTDAQNGKTVYTASIDGMIIVGPVAAHVLIDYDGSLEPPMWRLEAALAQPLELSDMINQFFGSYDFPDFLPGDLSIQELAVKAAIPSTPSSASANRNAPLALTRPARGASAPHHAGTWRSPVRPVGHVARRNGFVLTSTLQATPKSTYSVAATVQWNFEVTPDFIIDTEAKVGVSYDGTNFSGSVIGTVTIEAIGLEVEIGYRFGPAKDDVKRIRMPMTPEMLQATAEGKDSKVLWLAWKGFKAEYSFDKETVTFSMKGWTVGGLITALVEMIADPYFTLPSPWNVLDKISLDGLSIAFYLGSDPQKKKNPVTASYSLPSPIHLGFMSINGLSFKQVNGKTTIAIDGSCSVPGLSDSNLFKPESDGQDVKDMPKVPGRGNAYFNLNLMALGQRVAIGGTGNFKTTQAVIKAMSDLPSSDGDKLPFDPSTQKPGQPYYDPSAGWLAALHFGLLRVGKTDVYAVDLMIAFSDPNLAGLRLALNGDKMKVLAGLAIDVLYERVTDDIGRYSIEFTLPSVLRNLNFGAVSITLPTIGIEIYTNGDFKIDFGFPANMDFSRSFMVQAIIGGIPVLGAGGFYFGKLSNATAPGLPPTTLGTFDPVIVFGLGLQVGVGKKIDYGILKAGFAITVFGIIEGTLAAWHPYDGVPGKPGEVQGDYYFKISGTLGLIGELYGSVDFVIIKADVNLRIVVYVQITYESFRKIPMVLAASVQVSVSLKIDLWLFSITISFSFAAEIKVELTVGEDSQAPWDAVAPPLTNMLEDASMMMNAASLDFGPDGAFVESRTPPVPRTLFEHGLQDHAFVMEPDRGHAHLRAMSVTAKPSLEITAVVQTTVLGAEGADYDAQEGGLVLLFAMDAPVASTGDGPSDPGGNTSFGKLSEAFLPWIIASVAPAPEMRGMGSSDAVSRPHLEGILKALSDPTNAPFTAEQVLAFIGNNFEVTVSGADQTLSQARQDALGKGSAIFPAIDFLSMTVPDVNTTGDVTIDFAEYVTTDTAYQAELRRIFNEVAAHVANETGTQNPATMAAVNTTEPMAASIFADYFILLARQLVQAAIDRYDDYPYPLTTTTSLMEILDWANLALPRQLTPTALISANMSYPMNAGLTLSFADVGYMVQKGDSVTSIAARYADTADTLILTNKAQNNLIMAGILVPNPVDTGATPYLTQAGDSFVDIADGLGMTIDALAAQTAIQSMQGLLSTAVVMTIPRVNVITKDGDTVLALLDALHVPKTSFLTPENLNLAGLFKVDPTLHFAVPKLVAIEQSAIWPAILSTGTLGQTAGMASRYMMHGMRLPVAPGLALPVTGFMYGAPHWTGTQTGYGAYQLTGQQVPLASRDTATYMVKLERPTGSAYDWLKLGGGSTISFDIKRQADTLAQMVTSAKADGFMPDITLLKATPGTNLQPRSFGITNYVPWQTSDVDNLSADTMPPIAITDASGSDGPQARPMLFDLSTALTAAVVESQASLATHLDEFTALEPYLPVMVPRLGTTDPATSKTSFSDIPDYCLATRIDFKIKQLAQDADLSPQTPFGNDVTPKSTGNSGSPARALAPFSYEIIGPNPGQSVLLERLLSAMATGGEDMISGLYLTYLDINNGAKGLTSRAPDEFLSYIVQSNLSTETNPPRDAALMNAMLAEDPEPPTGIANKPAEFIKLLWELSTVNTSGTYLFYQLLNEGTGFPPSLFDDSGMAEITLVVTLARDPVLERGERFFNAVNAVVTTSPIDPQTSVIALAGVSDPATSHPIVDDATAAGIAVGYGIDLAGLAMSNTDVELTTGKQIAMSGLSRQITPEQAASSTPAAQIIAEYFSVGAATALTAAQIEAWNPGITGEALSVYRVPDFIYVVGDAGPGKTLQRIADYYGIDVPAVAFAARDVAGLFAASTLKIDPVAMEATPNLGPGNTALYMERARTAPPKKLPDAPTAAEIATYTQATLSQLYQLATARIVETPFFSGSRDTASFGPKDKTKPDADAPAAAARKTMTRLQSVGEDSALTYDQGFGYGAKAKVNATVPPTGKTGLPDVSLSPYKGVGTQMQAALDWQDLFGNRIPNPFNHVTATAKAPYGNLAIPIYYTDRLMPVDAWPSTTRSYRYGGVAGAPVLEFSLIFDTSPYEPERAPSAAALTAVRVGDDLPIWQRNAHADLGKFQEVYFQLTQDYTNAGVQGLTGPVVTMSLLNRLLAKPEQVLTSAQRDQVLSFICDAIAYLSARAAAAAHNAPADEMIAFDVDVTQVDPAQDILRLGVEMQFTRQPELVDPDLRALRGGISASSTIPIDGALKTPQDDDASDGDDPIEKPKYPVALTEFAADFEKVFVGDDWHLRLGTGAPDPTAPNTARTPTLWALRMAKAVGGKGIQFDVKNTPSYFAPEPIASQLQTIAPEVKRYQTGSPYPIEGTVKTTFNSVDPNVWLAECLTAIDDILAPSYSTPLFQLDRLLGLSETEQGGETPVDPVSLGYLTRLLNQKKLLAKAISSTALSVLEGGDAGLKTAAVEKLNQSLLQQLSNANTLTCVAVLPVTDAHYTPALEPGVLAPRLYGQPVAQLNGSTEQVASGQENKNLALSTAKIPLQSEAGVTDSTLAFLVTSRAAEQQPFVGLELDYSLTHVEFDIHGVPGIKEYQQSRWITLVTGAIDVDVTATGGEMNVPVALRALPTPATVVMQSGKAAHPDPSTATPTEIKMWNYEFSYLLNRAAQDSVFANVIFNHQGDHDSVNSDATALQLALYNALAQFIAIYPAVSRDLETYLRAINGTTKAANPDVANARDAVDALTQTVSAVAAAYQAWADPVTNMLVMEPQVPPVEFDFEMILLSSGDGTGKAEVEVSPQAFKVAGTDADYILPFAKVLIDDDHYEPEQVAGSADPKTGAVRWRYKRRPAFDGTGLPEYMPYATALTDDARAVVFDGLDLFALQNGWASLRVARNRHLSPDLAIKTTKAFEFETAASRFADPLVPLIDVPTYPLDPNATQGQEIVDWLTPFFTGLLTPGPGLTSEPVMVKVETRYAYNLVSNALQSVVPQTVLPISLLPPTSTNGQVDPPLVAGVGNMAQTWFDENNPVVDTSAQFNFDLMVFAGSGKANLPLLRVDALTLQALNVKKTP
ncbi:MAG: LysM domain-containing protein [Sulfitobacter sp.]